MVEASELVPGARFLLSAPVRAYCCRTVIPAGAWVEVFGTQARAPSPNRIYIESPLGAHKVRKSTLRMAAERIE